MQLQWHSGVLCMAMGLSGHWQRPRQTARMVASARCAVCLPQSAGWHSTARTQQTQKQ